jgi:hypothetical protein
MHQFLKFILEWNSTAVEQDRHGTAVPCRSSCCCSKAVYKPVWHISLLSVQWITPDDGQRNCPKHVEFHFQNKFKKLVHLVGFIVKKPIFVIRIVLPNCKNYYNNFISVCILLYFLLFRPQFFSASCCHSTSASCSSSCSHSASASLLPINRGFQTRLFRERLRHCTILLWD